MLIYLDHKKTKNIIVERTIIKTNDNEYIIKRKRYTKTKKLISQCEVSITEFFASAFINCFKNKNELKLEA